MKKMIGFIVGAGILVAIGSYFMTQSDGWVLEVVNWAKEQMKITGSTTGGGGFLHLPFIF